MLSPTASKFVVACLLAVVRLILSSFGMAIEIEMSKPIIATLGFIVLLL